MGYHITCCNCKKEINLEKREPYFVVQPTIFENNDWKRVTFAGFKQIIICIKCLIKKERWKKHG